jgi:hypothetical protein
MPFKEIIVFRGKPTLFGEAEFLDIRATTELQTFNRELRDPVIGWYDPETCVRSENEKL